jgi:sulfur relay (sulfurtransferase) complex TusBCD TusD component (DsrE family)
MLKAAADLGFELSRETGTSREVDPHKKGRLGIILYSAPSTSQFILGTELAKAALKSGYDVDLFAWGDAVYGTTRAKDGKSSASPSASELAGLVEGSERNGARAVIRVCTSCYKTRGLTREDAFPGATLGGLHNMVNMFRECDRTLALVP